MFASSTGAESSVHDGNSASPGLERVGNVGRNGAGSVGDVVGVGLGGSAGGGTGAG